MPGKYTHLILLNAWAKQTPLLGKGGVDAPSKNIPVPLKGADGVVRSNSKTISLERTTPVCAQLRWLRDISLMGAATPPSPRSSSNCPAGQTNNSKKLRRTKTKGLWAQLLERGDLGHPIGLAEAKGLGNQPRSTSDGLDTLPFVVADWHHRKARYPDQRE